MATKKKKLFKSAAEIHLELYKALLSNESAAGGGSGWDRPDGRRVFRAWSLSLEALALFLDRYDKPVKSNLKKETYFI
jgi:hypothetical protein